MSGHTPWNEVGDRVYRRRYTSFDLNVGLVLGEGQALLVDTRAGEAQARALRDEVRAVTRLPVRTVVNTHAHFDHCFGNIVFSDAVVWAHEVAARGLSRYGELQRRLMLDAAKRRAAAGDQDAAALAADLEATRLRPPDRTLRDAAALDIGGRRVELAFLGRGHTGGDLVVTVPDTGLVLAGDLVEEGAAPGFDDAWPLAWPGTLGRLSALVADRTVVPGHGDIVDAVFVRGQREEVTAVAAAVKGVLDGEADADAVCVAGPYPEPVMRTAMERARDTAEGIDRRVLPDR